MNRIICHCASVILIFGQPFNFNHRTFFVIRQCASPTRFASTISTENTYQIANTQFPSVSFYSLILLFIPENPVWQTISERFLPKTIYQQWKFTFINHPFFSPSYYNLWNNSSKLKTNCFSKVSFEKLFHIHAIIPYKNYQTNSFADLWFVFFTMSTKRQTETRWKNAEKKTAASGMTTSERKRLINIEWNTIDVIN